MHEMLPDTLARPHRVTVLDNLDKPELSSAAIAKEHLTPSDPEFTSTRCTMIQVAGVILCAFIVAHVTLYIAATMRQLASASQRDQLAQRLLLERISAANALRVHRE